MMAVGIGIIHGLFQVPFRGDRVIVGAAACLLIVAYLSIGALLRCSSAISPSASA